MNFHEQEPIQPVSKKIVMGNNEFMIAKRIHAPEIGAAKPQRQFFIANKVRTHNNVLENMAANAQVLSRTGGRVCASSDRCWIEPLRFTVLYFKLLHRQHPNCWRKV